MHQFTRGIQYYYAGKKLGQPGWYKINNWVKRAIIAPTRERIIMYFGNAQRQEEIDGSMRNSACVRIFTNFDCAYDAYLPLLKHNRNRIEIYRDSVTVCRAKR